MSLRHTRGHARAPPGVLEQGRAQERAQGRAQEREQLPLQMAAAAAGVKSPSPAAMVNLRQKRNRLRQNKANRPRRF